MARNDRNESLIIEMLTLLNRIESALVVRDPGSKISADAYDGLRKMLLQSSKNRRIHVSHLLSLSDSLNRDASMQLIKDRVNDFMTELGVTYWSDTSLVELFDVVEGDGPGLECIEPAVVERLEDGRIVEVRRGTARRVPGPEPVPTPETEVDENTTTGSPSDHVTATDVEPQPPEVSDISPRRSRLTTVIVVSALIFGFVLGRLASSGSDDSPKKSSTTTVAVPSSTSVVPDTTTTTEAGK